LLILVPGHPQAVYRLASAARALDDGAAEARARVLLELDPGGLAFAALLAERLAARGLTEDAVGVLRAVAVRHPASPLPWLNAAILLDRAGQPRNALAHYKAFMERFQKSPVALTLPLDKVIARVRYLEHAART
jgi:predicted Zn-dependent protease